MLEKIKNIPIKLGYKALIGAVINFILKSAASVVGFVAENLWTLMVAVGGLSYYELVAKTSNTKSKTTRR